MQELFLDNERKKIIFDEVMANLIEHGNDSDINEKRMDVSFLKNQHALFYQKHEFKINDLVQIKKGLKTSYNFIENQPIIVTEILISPIQHTEEDISNADYSIIMDIKIGVITRMGIYKEFYFNSQFFEPYQAQQ